MHIRYHAIDVQHTYNSHIATISHNIGTDTILHKIEICDAPAEKKTVVLDVAIVFTIIAAMALHEETSSYLLCCPLR